MNFVVGQSIYFLSDYKLLPGTVLYVGKKITVRHEAWHFAISDLQEITSRIDVIKCAHPEESIAIVWETWKGKNGRGAYRIERSLYKDRQRAACNWPRTHHLTETTYGTLS